MPADSPLYLLIDQVRQTEASVANHDLTLESPRLVKRGITVMGSPLPEEPGAIVLVLQDSSAALALDRQLAFRGAARSVTGMAAVLAHEVKNPLSGIRGAAQLLEASVDDSDRELTVLIRDEADRIRALVDRMEAFSEKCRGICQIRCRRDAGAAGRCRRRANARGVGSAGHSPGPAGPQPRWPTDRDFDGRDFLRSLLYNVLFYALLVFWILVGIPTFLMPRWATLNIAKYWGRSSSWLLGDLPHPGRISRLEKIPDGPLIVASKHQSMWETFALLQFFEQPLFILKRELMWISFFGWYLKKAGMIGIDRTAGGRDY